MTLSVELLLHAYASGVFPMAESRDDPEIFWVDPKRRGILPLDGFHISRSLAKTIRRGGYSIAINTDFSGVVQGCAAREETWINEEIFDRYLELHSMGYAHSLEVWEGAALIGGVYGVSLGAAFFGESMFSRRRDASKIALAYLVDRLNDGGFLLCDTQFITPHLASLGGQEIPRGRYRQKLAEALQSSGDFLTPVIPDPQVLLQRSTQTS
ncbi:leucyl/phenylalanyl-tRNA--protein transferase [Phaeobacter sp. HF9A]|uniref:leucyl/phenylalanyl-tRNA--protein transferase n=1 Tax=Phaeobacter sp. HF9A TaxID=2721561 RepID=UPI001432026E|nr:leucyl/phenylalanyl-tRNA--protein transferase [Phaeobacter sp. HF9A]NIZ14536.1 leucyl/phenylalanyl-tRNA--protein transferase [Phaeobacter sp. HF9A]